MSAFRVAKSTGSPVVPTLEDMLERMQQSLEEAKTVVNGSASGGLSQDEKDYVNKRLNDCETIIDSILDPNQAPSLEPPSAGTVNTGAPVNSLVECASSAAGAAEQAYTESQQPSPNQGYIGTRLKSLKQHILPPYQTFVNA